MRISGALREHVERTTSDGDYENVREYVRDLIRKDKATQEEQAFQNVKAQLKAAFAEHRASYTTTSLTAIKTLSAKRKKK